MIYSQKLISCQFIHNYLQSFEILKKFELIKLVKLTDIGFLKAR